jgi:hypothetical protein
MTASKVGACGAIGGGGGGALALAVDSVCGLGVSSTGGAAGAFLGLATDLGEADFALVAVAFFGLVGVFAVAMLVLPASFLPSGPQPEPSGLSFAAIIA